MLINHKILSIPPYISTSWKQVSSLHLVDKGGLNVLQICLHSGKTIEISNLDPASLKKIFTIHAEILAHEEDVQKQKPDSVFSFGFPLKFGIEGMENMGAFMQHNPKQASSPDLPPDILNKITTIAKSFGISESGLELPEAEPHCNCPYCQIARAFDQKEKEPPVGNEEEISSEDLAFREWDIEQQSDNLYNVTNPLDRSEQYQVYLGNPLGCTCGSKNCQHIRAVLNS